VEAEARETKAEIGIFRHVPGIPAADLAQNPGTKMIGPKSGSWRWTRG
jgi:hypothetical protein